MQRGALLEAVRTKFFRGRGKPTSKEERSVREPHEKKKERGWAVCAEKFVHSKNRRSRGESVKQTKKRRLRANGQRKKERCKRVYGLREKNSDFRPELDRWDTGKRGGPS